MTADLTTDPFDVVRRELRAATARDLRRRTRRAHALRVVAVAVGALVLLTGLAAAASDRVASVIGRSAGSIQDVFHGPAATKEPSARAQEMIQFDEDLHRGVNPEHRGDAPRTAPKGKVLLDEVIDGEQVEIVATTRPKGSPTAHGPSRQTETCYTVTRGGSTCTSAFNPGLPLNYGTGYEMGVDDVTAVISGITADDVVGVNVVTATDTERATMGDHAFYWRSGDELPTAIEAVMADGTTRRRPVEPFRLPKGAPLCETMPQLCG